MFKFTIRELLLLTLVVGLVIGWCLREYQLKGEVAEALKWRARTRALERFLNPEWRIEWHLETNAVTFYETGRRGSFMTIPIDASKPYLGHPDVDEALKTWNSKMP